NAELRNQLEFYSPRCVSLEVAPPGIASDSSATASPASPPDSSRRPAPLPSPKPPATVTKARPTAAFYSVQVAAYESPEPATRMARMLVSRGLQARVDGKMRPYRVRVGKYGTRAEAVKAAASLKSQGIGGFV